MNEKACSITFMENLFALLKIVGRRYFLFFPVVQDSSFQSQVNLSFFIPDLLMVSFQS